MTSETYESSIQRTYQYLRISVGVAGIVIGVAIAVDLINGGEYRPSISDFYYSDARNVFVGALFAVSLGLFALSGYGPQRLLLDAAAMFAPLIGLIPAPRSVWDANAADRGVWTYLVFGSLLLAFVVILRYAKTKRGIVFEDPTGFRRSVAIGAVWLVVLAVTFLFLPQVVRQAGHLFSAGAFFVLIALVALVHWRDRPLKQPTQFPKPEPLTPVQKMVYGIIGWALLADVAVLILAALVVKQPGWPLVAVLEAIALVLFSFFWFVQSWQRRKDPHPAIR